MNFVCECTEFETTDQRNPWLLLVGRLFRLLRVIELTCLNHVFLVVVSAIAIHVNTDFQLVLLSVANVAGIERETVLAAQ